MTDGKQYGLPIYGHMARSRSDRSTFTRRPRLGIGTHRFKAA
jgi:hypothetical protein